MKSYFKTALITIGILSLNLFTTGCHNHSSNFIEEVENSDGQKKFKEKLMAQQNTIDSMAKIYKGQEMIVNTFNDFNGDPKKIFLYDKSGFKILDTLKPGDTVQLIDVLPLYEFNSSNVPRMVLKRNTTVKTKKGVTGVIPYFFIQTFKAELKQKGLDTDTV